MPHQHAVLLFHGMGKHAPPENGLGGPGDRGDFGKEFITACDTALAAYPKHKGQSIEQHLDIYEFNYDSWFDKVRSEMEKKAESISDRLTAIIGAYNVSFPHSFAGELASLESKFGSDKFFYTHWLDTIFYASILGAKVRVDAGQAIAGLVQQYGGGNVHIFAHSLGTAIAHDTLARLFRPESDPNDNIPDLHPINHKLRSIWMVANVSRLVHGVTRLIDPMQSLVRPGDTGCTMVFNAVRHQLDPFTWISRFAPSNNGKWIPEPVYHGSYRDIVTTLVTNSNTHSVSQYLADPDVVERLFSQWIDFDVSAADLDEFRADYRQKSLQGAYALMEEEFKDLRVADLQSWTDFLFAAQNLQKAIHLVEKQLP